MAPALPHPLLQNIDGIHTTPMGEERLRRNLHLEASEDPAAWCIRQIQDAADGAVTRKGKNWYVTASNGAVITVNAHSFTIITAHLPRRKKEK